MKRESVVMEIDDPARAVEAAAAESDFLRAVASVRRDGGRSLALGDAPVRPLSMAETAELEGLGNRAEDWARVRVAERFDPRRVRGARFHGEAHQQDDLFVNKGNYQGATATAVSTIELTRGITLSTANQFLEFVDQFTAQLKQAGLSATVAVKDSGGRTVLTPLSYSTSTNSTTFQQFQVFQAEFNNLLKSGNYTLDVKVTYNTNNKIGGWKTVSQHHFTFAGL
jgi:hypothetical protein